jgi:eukaryotic-like serine/threonine-protein kinase
MITQVADYRILGPLGGGTEDRLFAAVAPPRLGLEADRVAIKIVDGLSSPEQVRRATDELRIFASVQSRYLVQLYDAGQEEDALFYSMEYPLLGSLAAPARALTASETLRAVSDAARGAHALHEAGIAHRNITPSRILLSEDGAKLADLGMAKFMSPGMTVTQTPDVGEIEYLDPAVIRGARPSRATDIWSLGVTLHWAMTDQSIHPGLRTQQALMAVRQVLNEPPLIADTLRPDIAEIVRSTLAPDPADRPGTAAALASLIDAARIS